MTTTLPRRDHWSDLERVLRGLIERYSEMLECLILKQEAIRKAELGPLDSILNRERELAAETVELDRERRTVSLAILGLPRDAQVVLSDVLARADASDAERLKGLAEELRRLVDETRRRSNVIRMAAESLSSHMSGLIQTIHAAISSSRVYGRRGRLIAPALEVSAVDLRS